MDPTSAGMPGWSSPLAIVVALVFIVVIMGIVVAVARALRQRAQDNRRPVQTLRAKVVTKRSNTSGGVGDSSTSTSYHVTLELPDGQRTEFRVSGREYGQLAEGDRGMLTHQGSRFQGFARELPEVPQ